jgi:hypothetical protein
MDFAQYLGITVVTHVPVKVFLQEIVLPAQILYRAMF